MPSKVTVVVKMILLTMLLVLTCFAVTAKAADNGVITEDISAVKWQFSLAVGYGQYDSMLFDEGSYDLLVLPRWSFYYGRFYIENLDIGFNLVESRYFSLDISGKQSFDALSVSHNDSKNALIRSIAVNDIKIGLPWNSTITDIISMQQRHLSYLGGLTLYARVNNIELRSELHTDISGVHQGKEWNNLLRLQQQFGNIEVVSTIGARWLDTRYADYYFGLDYAETRNKLSNNVSAMWLPSLRLDTSYKLSNTTRLIASIKREWYPSDIKDSLFIGQRHHDIWFIGLMYTW